MEEKLKIRESSTFAAHKKSVLTLRPVIMRIKVLSLLRIHRISKVFKASRALKVVERLI